MLLGHKLDMCGVEHLQTTAEEMGSVIAQQVAAVCLRLMNHTPGIKIALMAVMPRGRGRGLEHEWVESLEELAPLPNQ